eukprot:NODE_1788_length_1062_cov_479.168818.p2 GENE.NODE_1788_length_1062_cov_479.168818~~NODE_1788_length_1062_cov_479.168818.p2  ORF type:complete len:290 (-),score=107.09 NODE_1788_length_1062_cov_479.168818:175-1044(-)
MGKYNQLLRIEEELGSDCVFAGVDFRNVGIPAKGMPRKPVVGGNWKCNGTLKSVKDLLTGFAGTADSERGETVIFPPSLFIGAARAASNNSKVSIGVQNASKTAEGAFTGEVTMGMVKDLGLEWVLVGHSERRALYGETDADCAAKVQAALAAGLNVMFCIGERLEERQTGKTKEVCCTQLQAVIPVIRAADWARVVIAYEPVWAIGTGVVATPMQAQDAHYQVRMFINDQVGAPTAQAVRILYGGSVSPANCTELGALPDVDGFLVGGASLKASFTDIIKSAQDLYRK